MIFLVEYDRLAGRILTFAVFEDSERSQAADRRLEIELALNGAGINHEVVLLDAASEEALRRTHRRYFESPSEIVKSTSTE